MRLRFHGPEATSDREPGRLIFPRAALDQARRSAPHSYRPATPTRTGGLLGAIDAELDTMQHRLDTLRHDVEHFKFPSPDDGDRPSAA